MTAIGLVTIGQAPRTDLLPDVRHLLSGVRAIEHGALDDLTAADIDLLAPDDGETPLVSRLRDGSSVRLSPGHLPPRLAVAVKRCVDDGASAVLIVCTGSLPHIDAPIPVLHAESLAHGGVKALIGEDSLGVIGPLPDQVPELADRWRTLLGRTVHVDHADPYRGDLSLIRAAAARLVERGVQWIFLDCIGYGEEMRAAAAEAGVPVLLARTLAVRLAAELAHQRPQAGSSRPAA